MQDFSEKDSLLKDTLIKDTLILKLTNHPSIGLACSKILDQKEFSSKTFIFELPRGKTIILEIERPSRALIYFSIFFVSLQVADGMLTSIGMTRFGVHGEGNPFLRNLMHLHKPDHVLLVVKTIAVMIIIALTVIARKVSWIKDLIGTLSCIYLFAAIIPWVYILTFYF